MYYYLLLQSSVHVHLISFCYFEFQLYPDNFAKREMMGFTVTCHLKKSKGCDWKGALEKLQVFQGMKCYFSMKCYVMLV